MKTHLKNVFIAVLLFFISFKCSSLEIKPLIISDDIFWSFETTKGYQNVKNSLMSKEDGGNALISEALNFEGILFHSFYKKRLMTKAQFNLGFSGKTNFLWSESPNFLQEENINEKLRCIELDVQKMFPFLLSSNSILEPFAGYSFFECTYNVTDNGLSGDTDSYNYILGGIQYLYIYNKIFSGSFFISYSPFVYVDEKLSKVQFINYGFEVITDTHPLSVTLFFTTKKAFTQRGVTWFSGNIEHMKNSEIGFSLHLNLW